MTKTELALALSKVTTGRSAESIRKRLQKLEWSLINPMGEEGESLSSSSSRSEKIRNRRLATRHNTSRA